MADETCRSSRRNFLRFAFGSLATSILPTLAPAAVGADVGYSCTPCGLACDKQTFDNPGSCPGCGMKLLRRGTPVNIEMLMDGYRIPALSVAIIDNFRIAATRTYGVSEAGGSRHVTPRTLFQAGSISKPVAALGALHLVEQGKLSLDDDVNHKLKGWRVPENGFTQEQKVTLRRLLSHSSGLTVHGFAGYTVGQQIPTLPQILEGTHPANNPPVRADFVPGSRWRYSGGGLLVAQQLMIDVSGMSFPKLMHQAVFERLGMRDSSFEQPLSRSREHAAAAGTRGDGAVVPGKWHIYPEMAAAGLWTTPSDLARFAIEIALSKRGRSNRVISQAMAGEMLKAQMPRVEEIALGDTQHRDRMGLGVFLGDDTRPDLFGHIGDDAGFQAMLLMFADTGKGAAIMANSPFGIMLGDYVLDGIATEYNWTEYVSSFRAHADHPAVTKFVSQK